MSGIPGLKIGPLDPDRTSEWGLFSQQANARDLIRLHSQMYHPSLSRALSLKRDDERTKGLDMEEVEGYLKGLKLENGDSVIPDDCELSGATVRGERGRPQVLCFTYTVQPSGRIGKWFAPYDRDELPSSAEAGDQFVKVREMTDRGIVEYDREGAGRAIDQRELAALRRQVKALAGLVEARGSEEQADVDLGAAGDIRSDAQIAEENEALRRQVQELTERQAALEQAAELAGQRAVQAEGQEAAARAEEQRPAAAQDPPFEGYDNLKAQELAERVKSDETSEDDVRAIGEYERGHSNRLSVTRAVEERLGRTG